MNYSERSKFLLEKLWGKELAIERFLYECAMWMFESDIWNTVYLFQYPSTPKEYVEYEQLPLDKRLKVDSSFFHQPNIKDYLFRRGKVYSQNWGLYKWFEEMKKYIPDDEEHFIYHKKLDERLIEFELWIKNTSPEAQKAKEVFEGEYV